MAEEKTPKRRTLLCEKDLIELSLREVVLESLLQLHIDFRDLGCIADAGPLLHTLMELAYRADGSLPSGQPSHDAAKTQLN